MQFSQSLKKEAKIQGNNMEDDRFLSHVVTLLSFVVICGFFGFQIFNSPSGLY